jgi:hypothetical protein
MTVHLQIHLFSNLFESSLVLLLLGELDQQGWILPALVHSCSKLTANDGHISEIPSSAFAGRGEFVSLVDHPGSSGHGWQKAESGVADRSLTNRTTGLG